MLVFFLNTFFPEIESTFVTSNDDANAKKHERRLQKKLEGVGK